MRRGSRIVTFMGAVAPVVAGSTAFTGCGETSCDWLYSTGGSGALVRVNTEPGGDVNRSLGNPFGNATSIGSEGYTDFNGDGKSDVFRAIPSDIDWQWMYKSGGTGLRAPGCLLVDHLRPAPRRLQR